MLDDLDIRIHEGSVGETHLSVLRAWQVLLTEVTCLSWSLLVMLNNFLESLAQRPSLIAFRISSGLMSNET